MSSTTFEQISPPQQVPAIPLPRTDPDRGRLVINRGPGTGTGFPLSRPVVTIGRHRDNDIALGDPTVSARHAEIRADGDRYLITDVGSFNGTYVNRRPVDQAELHDGDEVWVGRHRLIFQVSPVL
jgi:pSer/pThr/pTyr-binding forkhead associated (FHA) protein